MGDLCPDENNGRNSVQRTVSALCHDRLIRAFHLRFLHVGLDGLSVDGSLLVEFEMDNPNHVAFSLERDSGHNREGRQWREQALRPS